MELTELIQQVNIVRQILPDDGTFPNNGLLPLLFYQKALRLPEQAAGKAIIDLLDANDWHNAWENGIYDYHHYHSTAHEVLAVTQGSARVQFGGPAGTSYLLEKGDAVVIPAGVAHKALDVYDDFKCVGAYPAGQNFDLLTGKKGEREQAKENIKGLPLPSTDPFYGADGPLTHNWK